MASPVNPFEDEEVEWKVVDETPFEGEEVEWKIVEEKEEEPEIPKNKAWWEYIPSVESLERPVMETTFAETPGERVKEVAEERPKKDIAIARGAASGLSLGLTETILNMAGAGEIPPEYKSLEGASDLVASVAPLHGLFKLTEKAAAPLIKMAAKSPYAKGTISAMGRVLQSAAVGVEEETLRSLFQGELPDPDEIMVKGAEWGLLDIGLQAIGKTGRFAISVFRASEETGQNPVEVVNRLFQEMKARNITEIDPTKFTKEALELLEKPEQWGELAEKVKLKTEEPISKAQEIIKKPQDIKPGDLSKRKFDPKVYDTLNKNLIEEPEVPDIDTGEIFEEMDKPVTEEVLDRHSKRAETDIQAGETIKENIDENFRDRKAAYNEAYDRAYNIMGDEKTPAQSFAREMFNVLKDVLSMKTKPPGYNAVKEYALQGIEDAGYFVKRDAKGKPIGLGKNKAKDGKMTVREKSKLNQRLKEVVDYEMGDPSVTDKLKKPIARNKASIKRDMAKDKVAKQYFEEAEKLYAETEQLYGTEAVKKLRDTHAPEKIVKQLQSSPTALSDAKKVMSPKEWRLAEREILDHINSLSYKEANKYLRNVKNILGEEARGFAERIVQTKVPGKPGRIAKTKMLIENQLSKAGKPNELINVWGTQTGRKEITEALKNSPNKEKIIDYLHKATIFKEGNKFITDAGKLDYKKLNEFLKNPMFRDSIEQSAGKEGVEFLRNMDAYVNNFEKNLNSLNKMRMEGKLTNQQIDSWMKEAKERVMQNKEISEQVKKQIVKDMEKMQFPLLTSVEGFVESLDDPVKTALYTALTLSLAPSLGKSAAIPAFYVFFKSPQVRRALRYAGQGGRNPYHMWAGMKIAENVIEKD